LKKVSKDPFPALNSADWNFRLNVIRSFRPPHSSTDFQVCVVGWYYLPAYFEKLAHLPNVHIIAHRPHSLQEQFPGCNRENVGLEWGAYDHFLSHFWNGTAAVLFTHDDIQVPCSEIGFLEYVRRLRDHPSLFVGPSYTQFFVLKSAALERVRNDGGFWFDRENHGNVTRNKWRVNRGARAFRSQLARINLPYEHVPCDGILNIGIRGRFQASSEGKSDASGAARRDQNR
jgi:hypothetical protein